MKIDQPNKNTVSLSMMISAATLNQLNCALKNLKGGKNYLLALIGKRNFCKLLQKGKIQPHDSHLYADIEEKSGNALRMVITVFTSGLGIWMGLADFLASGHRSWQQLLWASGASVLIGILLSFLSYHFAAKRAREAVLQKKLINLQSVFLNMMIDKIDKKISGTKNRLYKDLSSLDDKLDFSHYILFFEENDKVKLSKIGKEILAMLRQKMRNELNLLTATSPFSQYLFNNIFKQFKKIIIINMKNSPDKCFLISRAGKQEQNNPQLIFKLPQHFTKSNVTFISWLIGSSLGIFLETIPVFVGTFAAFFLFLNGLPDTLKKLGYDNVTAYFDNPWTKYGSLAFAILFVVYLGASQAKFSYKSYLRSKNIEDAREKVAEKEVKYACLHRRYRLSNKFSRTLKVLLSMLTLSQAVKK